ncbi:hypothetical protein ACROYT_G027919 [Oculina patagonica]
MRQANYGIDDVMSIAYKSREAFHVVVSLSSTTKRATSRCETTMVQYCVTDLLCFLCVWVFAVAALKDNKHSKTTLSVTINDTAIIPCPVLAEVINKDGKFDLLSWKICTSERCDDQDTTWGWLGGMNHKGTTKVSREGIKINSDGALEIKNVQLGDTGRYMCTIKRIRHTSPKRHFVALTVNRVATADQERQTTNKTDPLNCKKDYSDDSGNLVSLNTSKPFQPVTHEKAIMPCPILHDVVKKDGAYKIVYWSICTSRRCDDQRATWTWIAGRNNKGETKVGREGINITIDGALGIPKVRLSDAGKYMCTVKRINYKSPRKHFATLVVIKDGVDNTERSQRVSVHENAVMICPVFKQVIKLDGAFYNVYWSNCTSSCDEVNLTWDWMAGINGTGTPKVERKGISITMNGTLEIHNVQLSDAGRYMCTVKRIGHRSPRVYFTALIVEDGVGNFTFEMDMFKDPKYDIVVNQYPVTVPSGQPMYLQVNVKSRDRSLLTFLEECWVTPTPDPRDQTRHTLIEEGCSRDASLQYLYEKSPLQKFTFKAFRFRDVLSRRLYVHCEVVTCRRSDSWSVCERGCKKDGRQRREDKAFIMDKDVFLSLGPVNFQDQTEESHEPVVYVKGLAGVLGALALILLIAVVILILRRRKLRENKNNTWILLATREHSVQEEKQTDRLQKAQAEM